MLPICRALQHSSWIILLDSSMVISSFFEVCHYAGFFLVVGSIVLVDLRLLGVAGRGHSATLIADQLFPWMWIGLAFAFVSGFFMFAADAVDFYRASFFRLKMLTLLVALLVGITVQWRVPRWDRSPSMPLSAKVVAVISLLLWVGTILVALEVPAINGVG